MLFFHTQKKKKEMLKGKKKKRKEMFSGISLREQFIKTQILKIRFFGSNAFFRG